MNIENNINEIERILERKGLTMVESNGDYRMSDSCKFQYGGVLGDFNIPLDTNQESSWKHFANVVKATVTVTEASTGEVIASASSMAALNFDSTKDCSRAVKAAVKKLKLNINL